MSDELPIDVIQSLFALSQATEAALLPDGRLAAVLAGDQGIVVPDDHLAALSERALIAINDVPGSHLPTMDVTVWGKTFLTRWLKANGKKIRFVAK
jgi:hypothetical protein